MQYLMLIYVEESRWGTMSEAERAKGSAEYMAYTSAIQDSKHWLGGYYLIEAKDLDEACAVAARCPGARHGTIEVRPISPLTV